MKLTIEVEHFSGPELGDELAPAMSKTFGLIPDTTFAILPDDRALAVARRGGTKAEVGKALSETEASTYKIVGVS